MSKCLAKHAVGPILGRRRITRYVEAKNRETSVAASSSVPQQDTTALFGLKPETGREPIQPGLNWPGEKQLRLKRSFKALLSGLVIIIIMVRWIILGLDEDERYQ